MPNSLESLDYTLLQRLTQAFGPSGCEDEVAEIISNELRPFSDEISRDTMGNLIVHRRGVGRKIMVAAHMDEIGLIITHIDEKGFLRFAPVGGVRIPDLPYRRVRLSNGHCGTVGVEKLDKPSDIKLDKLYIDLGLSSKEEVLNITKIGDMVTFVGEFQECGAHFMSKAMDDRIGCFIAIETLKRTESSHDLFFVFTAQEEVGARGAQTAAYAIEPDLAIAVDITATGDTPNCGHMAVKSGHGPAIKVLDRSMVTPPQIKRWMADTAEAVHIPYQWEVLEYGGTDSGAIHLTKGGIPAGVLSIPTRYFHSPAEMVNRQDVERAIQLLVELLITPPEL